MSGILSTTEVDWLLNTVQPDQVVARQRILASHEALRCAAEASGLALMNAEHALKDAREESKQLRGLLRQMRDICDEQLELYWGNPDLCRRVDAELAADGD